MSEEAKAAAKAALIKEYNEIGRAAFIEKWGLEVAKNIGKH